MAGSVTPTNVQRVITGLEERLAAATAAHRRVVAALADCQRARDAKRDEADAVRRDRDVLARDLAAARAALDVAAQEREQLVGEAIAARAELDRLRGRVRMEDHVDVLNQLAAARAEAARLKEAIQTVLHSPCVMGCEDIDLLLKAQKREADHDDK